MLILLFYIGMTSVNYYAFIQFKRVIHFVSYMYTLMLCMTLAITRKWHFLHTKYSVWCIWLHIYSSVKFQLLTDNQFATILILINQFSFKYQHSKKPCLTPCYKWGLVILKLYYILFGRTKAGFLVAYSSLYQFVIIISASVITFVLWILYFTWSILIVNMKICKNIEISQCQRITNVHQLTFLGPFVLDLKIMYAWHSWSYRSLSYFHWLCSLQ